MPPVCGNADASSAQTSEPKKVKRPQIAHVQKTPLAEGTQRVISEGWTKIEAPMIVPTTIAVAWIRPMERFSSLPSPLGASVPNRYSPDSTFFQPITAVRKKVAESFKC